MHFFLLRLHILWLLIGRRPQFPHSFVSFPVLLLSNVLGISMCQGFKNGCYVTDLSPPGTGTAANNGVTGIHEGNGRNERYVTGIDRNGR